MTILCLRLASVSLFSISFADLKFRATFTLLGEIGHLLLCFSVEEYCPLVFESLK